MFIYDEETRKHTLNGKHIVSVSQVIEPLYDFSGIDPEVLERKGELGDQFHEAIRLYFHDDLDFDSLDPDIIKPMSAFVHWWNDKFNILDTSIYQIEQPICNERLKYCGKPDLVTPFAIFDWKLRPFKGLTDILQLEGYKHILPPGKRDRWTVCFNIEGKMTMHRCRHPKAWGIFRKMLERYYRELEFSQLMENWKGLN
ncbi:MAG: hypothetical protein CMB80_01925 [Flammeovirgaceae bacterium]|nr:hypothetical protein [Flammeovirgaceae bacterium]